LAEEELVQSGLAGLWQLLDEGQQQDAKTKEYRKHHAQSGVLLDARIAHGDHNGQSAQPAGKSGT
jgi:hypothetical protein